MRRRKGSKYRWFPTAGSFAQIGESVYAYSWYSPQFIQPQPSNVSPPALGTDINYFPLVRDESQSEAFGQQQGVSLRDYVEGQDWLVKRLVGSVFVFCGGSADPSSHPWSGVKVTCGIAVARAKDADGEVIDLDPVDYDPDNMDNSADSWLWRRTWLLSKPVQTGDLDPPGTYDGIFPNFNGAAGYGDIRSGTHIDSKVARRITRELRLWFIYRVVGFNGTQLANLASQANQPPVSVLADIRVLGGMRRGRTTKTL